MRDPETLGQDAAPEPTASAPEPTASAPEAAAGGAARVARVVADAREAPRVGAARAPQEAPGTAARGRMSTGSQGRVRDVWSTASHDTMPSVEVSLSPTHAYLMAFLRADGESFAPPYTSVRQNIRAILDEQVRQGPGQRPRDDVEDQRLRTWKSMFEDLGFLFVDTATDRLRLTALGRLLRSMYDELGRRVEGANDHIAKLAVAVLNRHRLRNPLDPTPYPADSDVHPFRFMWKAMRQLDDALHWEEMNRVLMHVIRRESEGAAIDKIREARRVAGGKFDDAWLALLGEPSVDEGSETRRRITPWFTKAGFGGLLVAEADSAGFWRLVADRRQLIDEALQEDIQVPPEALASRAGYLQYLADDSTVAVVTSAPSDEADVARVVSAVERHGSRKIVVLSGLPGTGKTRLARIVAQRLTGGDPYRIAEIQFHESTSYEDLMEGFVPRPSGEGFELTKKTLRVINRRAQRDPRGDPYVLLIEEFTRANVHAVLGELLTYVEHRDRTFQLPLSQEDERIAPNLVILATMNPHDRSAMVLDHAIIRRLHRISLESSPDRLRLILAGQLDQPVLDRLITWFESFKDVLPFGHAEFAQASTEDDLRELWSGTLRHFLTDTTGRVRSVYESAEREYPWRSTSSA